MRSSKSRSRSKSNRPRPMGNIVNRVFDSSGPEGKVRGTPQQIIDKYLILARDAQLSNDRVAAENFLQHAEHYTRMLGEAQRELQREADTRREGQDNNFRDRQQRRDNGNERDNGGDQPDQPSDAQPDYARPHETSHEIVSSSGPADVIDLDPSDEGEASTLVETPESRRPPARPPRAERPPRAAPPAEPVVEQPAEVEAQPEVQETAAPVEEEKSVPRPRRRAAPRKPKPKAEGTSHAPGETTVAE